MTFARLGCSGPGMGMDSADGDWLDTGASTERQAVGMGVVLGAGLRRSRLPLVGMIAALGLSSVLASSARAYVYWANRGNGGGSTLGRANLDGTGANPSFISGATGPVGVTVDGSHVYWANAFGSGMTLGRANLDGTGANQSFISSGDAPCGVAVDASHIYWANFNGNSIGRANLDGTAANPSFITTGVSGPCGVAVDASFIYWANEGPTRNGTTIGRAHVDGGSPSGTFITGLSVPVGVAVNGSFVYWGNSGSNTVGRASLDGTGVNASFITGADAPCGVAVNASHIYWGNFHGNNIGQANLDGSGANESFITTGVSGPCGVAVNQLAPLAVALAGPGSGSVSGSGISCPGTCSRSYTLGQQVTLTATPTSGSTFTGWSGAGCSGSGTCTVTIGDTNAVIATFASAGSPKSTTTITKKKISRKKHTAKFTFTAPGATGFQCALVRVMKGKGKKKHKQSAKPHFKSCSSLVSYKHLKKGKYKFEVRALNPAGIGPAVIKSFRI